MKQTIISTGEFQKLWKATDKEYTHMVYNVSTGISVISHNKENAEKIAAYMSNYHSQKFAVKENK